MSLWLAKDQRSNEVLALQNALNVRLEPAQPLALDGIFGPHTETSVKAFQSCEGLTADGIAGPHTLNALFERATITQALHFTSPGRFMVAARPPGFGPAAPMTRSPYDPPHRPPPSPESLVCEWLRRFEPYDALVRNWFCEAPPKRDLPKPMPIPPPLESSGAAGSNTRGSAPTSRPLPWRLPHRKLTLAPERHSAKESLLSDELFEFVISEDFEYRLREFEAKLVFTFAVVRASKFVIPSASFAASPDGRFGGKLSLQVLKTNFYEHEWKKLALGPGTFSIAPRLVGSMTLQRHPEFEFFGGLRFGFDKRIAKFGRNIIDLSAGMSVGALIIGEHETEGGYALHPFAGQGLIDLEVKFAREARERH